MKLSILDRVLLGGILATPRAGDYLNLKTLQKAREDLSFDEAETKVLRFRDVGANILWDGTRAIVKATGKPLEVDPEDLKKDPDIVRKMVEAAPDDFRQEPSVEDKEVALGDFVSDLIETHLKALNDAEPPRLPEDHMPLYERFVIEKKPKKPKRAKKR